MFTPPRLPDVTPEYLRDKPQRLRRRGEAREDRAGIGDAEMRADNLGEDAAEVRRHREVASLVALLRREARPAAVDPAALHVVPADDEHGVAVPVIGAAVAVLGHGPAELAHRQDHHVVHAIAEIARQRGDALTEV